MAISKDDVISEISEFGFANLALSDGDEVRIMSSSEFIGGGDDEWMCDMLGNVGYSSIESCVNHLFAWLNKNDLEVIDLE